MTDISIGEKIARLRHTLLFGDMSPQALRSVALSAEDVSVEQGATVVHEGEPGDAMYVVTRGLLRAQRRLESGRDEVLGDLNKGGFFGEFALLESRPRTATVQAVTASQLLRLSRASMQLHFAAYPELAARVKATLERRRKVERHPFRPQREAMLDRLVALLAGVERSALEALGKEIEWLWLPAGETLLREGEPGDAVFFVLDGRLRVFTRGAGGAVVAIGEVGKGESIGEMALLSGAPRSASASAVLDTQLLRLSPEVFDSLLADHPEVMDSFRQVMLARVALRERAEARSVRSPARRPVTLEDCEQVMRTRDLVLRNLKITQSYHRLALDLIDLLGPQDLNWLAFGAHASKTAGYAIRKEEIPGYELYGALAQARYLGPVLQRVTRFVGESFLMRNVDRVLERTSAAISDGNLRIFADMAPVIVRFIELVRGDASCDQPKMDAFRATLKPGPSDGEGQEILGLALAAWYEAAHEHDPKRKSELVLLGNARVGWHEQIRVQPDIVEALGSPLRMRLGDELGQALDQRLRRLPAPLRFTLRRGANALEPLLLDAAASALRRIMTRRMMRLRLPYESLRLGADVTAGRGKDLYPPELRELTHPDLKALMERFARADASARGSGAADWTSLEQRMNYIIHFFRSRQKSLELFTAPLQADQLAAIDGEPERGCARRPDGASADKLGATNVARPKRD